MTDKQIQQALLDYYKKNLESMPNDFVKAQDYLLSKFMHDGLCTCAWEIFDLNIGNERWITCNYSVGSYWCRPPFWQSNIIDIKEAVTHRIYLLEKLLSQYEQTQKVPQTNGKRTAHLLPDKLNFSLLKYKSMFKRLLVILAALALSYLTVGWANHLFNPTVWSLKMAMAAMVCTIVFLCLYQAAMQAKQPLQYCATIDYHGHNYFVEELDEDGAICICPDIEDAKKFDTIDELNEYMKNVKSAWNGTIV